MDRKDFFKKCGKYIGGAVAAVAVGNQQTKAQEIQGVISETEPVTLEGSSWHDLDVDVIDSKTIRIHGVPKNNHVSIRYHEDCSEIITQDLNFSKESVKTVRVYGIDKESVVKDVISDIDNDKLDIIFE